MNKIAKSITRVRNELFGLAILSIMVFHYFEDVTLFNTGGRLLAFAKQFNFYIGSVGVDIFLFLSGMGLFFSLAKTPGLGGFYVRRFQRVVPAYLLIGAVGWAVRDLVVGSKSVWGFFKDLTTVSFWVDGNRGVWYISFILIMYALFPLLFKAANAKNVETAKTVLKAILLAVTALLLWMSVYIPTFYKGVEIALWRIPIFIVGMWYGRKAYYQEELRGDIWLLFIVGLVMKLLVIPGKELGGRFFWFFNLRAGAAYYAVPILIGLTALVRLLPDGIVRRFLRWMGSISLEVYLIHVFVRSILKDAGYNTTVWWLYPSYIAASVILAWAVHKLVAWLTAPRKTKGEGKS